MASKGGVIAVSAIVGLGALFAFAATAKAGPKGGGPIIPPGEEPDSPAACAAYKSSKASLITSRNQVQNQINAMNQAMTEAAAAGDEAALAALASQRQQAINTIGTINAKISELDALIAACP